MSGIERDIDGKKTAFANYRHFARLQCNFVCFSPLTKKNLLTGVLIHAPYTLITFRTSTGADSVAYRKKKQLSSRFLRLLVRVLQWC